MPESTVRGGIPTARNVDHFAFTVPNLDEAVDFFVDVLGADVAYRLGPVEDTEGDWMSRQLGVHPKASAHIAMLRLGPTSNVELFEYDAPGQRTDIPANSDVGGHHLAFYVDDVDAAVEYLRAQPGVTVLGEPQVMPEGAPNTGDRWIYFLTPWGLQLEVHSVPERMPYQDHVDGCRFGPCPSWGNDRGIPTARNVDHVAYTVEDLDEAVAFFVDVIGAELLYRLGPVELDAEFMKTQLNVPAAGTVRQALLRLGPTDNLELFQYDVPGQRTDRPANSDVGGHHLAFFVDDVDAAVEYLRAQAGVEILGEPQDIHDGPIAGDRWVYFRTPFGLSLEVLNLPDGSLPYERDTDARRRAAEPGGWDNRAVPGGRS